MVVRFITIAFYASHSFTAVAIAIVIIAFATLNIAHLFVLFVFMLHCINILEHERHVQTRVSYACLSAQIETSLKVVDDEDEDEDGQEEGEENMVHEVNVVKWSEMKERKRQPNDEPNDEPNRINSIEAATQWD